MTRSGLPAVTAAEIARRYQHGYLRFLTWRGTDLGRICAGCGAWKPLDDFTWTRHISGAAWVESRCRPCNATHQQRWRDQRRPPERLALLTEQRAGVQHRVSDAPPEPALTAWCDWCHAPYTHTMGRRRFCSYICGQAWGRGRHRAARRALARDYAAYWDMVRFEHLAAARVEAAA